MTRLHRYREEFFHNSTLEKILVVMNEKKVEKKVEEKVEKKVEQKLERKVEGKVERKDLNLTQLNDLRFNRVGT